MAFPSDAPPRASPLTPRPFCVLNTDGGSHEKMHSDMSSCCLQGLQGSLRTQGDESQLGGEDWGSNLALSVGSGIVTKDREEHYLTWKNLVRAPWICAFIWGV